MLSFNLLALFRVNKRSFSILKANVLNCTQRKQLSWAKLSSVWVHGQQWMLSINFSLLPILSHPEHCFYQSGNRVTSYAHLVCGVSLHLLAGRCLVCVLQSSLLCLQGSGIWQRLSTNPPTQLDSKNNTRQMVHLYFVFSLFSFKDLTVEGNLKG